MYCLQLTTVLKQCEIVNVPIERKGDVPAQTLEGENTENKRGDKYSADPKETIAGP